MNILFVFTDFIIKINLVGQSSELLTTNLDILCSISGLTVEILAWKEKGMNSLVDFRINEQAGTYIH